MIEPDKDRTATVLSHYVPLDVLRKADELAQQFEREEAFRVYLLKRMWLVIPACLVLLVITIYATGFVVRHLRALFPPDLSWADAVAAFAVMIIGFGGFFLELYVIFKRLERRYVQQGGQLSASGKDSEKK